MRKKVIVGFALVLLFAVAPAVTAAECEEGTGLDIVELVLDWLGLADECESSANMGPIYDPGG